jgi:hypothetical protein
MERIERREERRTSSSSSNSTHRRFFKLEAQIGYHRIVLQHQTTSISSSPPHTTTMAAVLITGATGKQGGSVIRSLIKLNAPFQILAVTRNTKSASALKLTQLSPKIKLVEGDLDDPAAMFKNARSKLPASTPIWGVFSVQVRSRCET